MIEPTHAILAKEVADGAKEITPFLRTLLGPALHELGETLADRARVYRFKNQLKLLERADNYLRDAGYSPNTVPPRVLLPLLEHASLENDEKLAEMWAALLANAAIGGAVKASIYVDVLRQISPAEARTLESLLDPIAKGKLRVLFIRGIVQAEAPKPSELSAEDEEFLATLTFSDVEDVVIAFEHLVSLGMVQRNAQLSSVGLLAESSFSLTLFGERLLHACRAPV